MIKFLPASFEGSLTQPRNALVAHSGIAPVLHSTEKLHASRCPSCCRGCRDKLSTVPPCTWHYVSLHCQHQPVSCAGMSDMAQMLFHELRPFLVEAQAANLPVTLGEFLKIPQHLF